MTLVKDCFVIGLDWVVTDMDVTELTITVNKNHLEHRCDSPYFVLSVNIAPPWQTDAMFC